MDLATLIGIVVAFVAIMASTVMEGGNPAAIIAPPALLLVFVGTFGVAMACGTMADMITSLKAVKNALLTKAHTADGTVGAVMELAERARREGLLSLEEAVKSVNDPFLKKGIEMAVDGTDPDELRDILEAEISAVRQRGKASSQLFESMGGFAPTLGIIGTVLGLVHVLENLSEPDKLGHLIAGAFLATLWGVLSANVFWLPIASKLKRITEIDCHHMEIVLEGVLSVQAGSNPRIIEQKLLSLLGTAPEKSDLEQAA
ncbi:MAG: motA [Acidimicrobiales bacterium]|jgi:chemotaxis protein MotA|nr:motA [Acidimicrobiales bacterium]